MARSTSRMNASERHRPKRTGAKAKSFTAHGNNGGSLDRAILLKCVFVLILVCLVINGALVCFNLADGRSFAERLGAVFYGACGALTTLLVRGRP